MRGKKKSCQEKKDFRNYRKQAQRRQSLFSGDCIFLRGKEESESQAEFTTTLVIFVNMAKPH